MKKQILLCILSATLPSQLFGLHELTKPIEEFFVGLFKKPYNFTLSIDAPENDPIIQKESDFFNIFEEATGANPSKESITSALALNLFKQGLFALSEQAKNPASRYTFASRANV